MMKKPEEVIAERVKKITPAQTSSVHYALSDAVISDHSTPTCALIRSIRNSSIAIFVSSVNCVSRLTRLSGNSKSTKDSVRIAKLRKIASPALMLLAHQHLPDRVVSSNSSMVKISLKIKIKNIKKIKNKNYRLFEVS